MIHFEVLKPYKSFDLDVSLTDSFSEISKQIFAQFNLNQKDFEKFPSIKFIYNSVICLNFKTLQTYGIKDQSTIQVFIPKQLLPYFLNPSLQIPTKKAQSNANPHNKTANQGIFSDNINNFSNPILTDLPDINTQFPMNTSTTPIHSISSTPTRSTTNPQTKTQENVNHSIVLKLANQSLLDQLTSAGFDRLDAAYALVYKSNYNRALGLIKRGISSDEKYRFHVDSIISSCAASDDAIMHEIEIAKLEAVKMNENEEVAAAAVMTEANFLNPITNPAFQSELRKKCQEVEVKFPGKIYEKFQKNMNDGKQVIFNYNGKLRIFDSKSLCANHAENLNKKKTKSLMMTREQKDFTNQAFAMMFQSIPEMSPDDFTNPFDVMYDDLLELNANIEGYKEIADFGRKMNYEQMMFVYNKCFEKKVHMNYVIQYLMLFDGNIEEASKALDLN